MFQNGLRPNAPVPRDSLFYKKTHSYRRGAQCASCYFEGNQPLLSIADPELVRQILVKDFYAFSERRTIVTGDPIVDKMMSLVTGEDWKRIRTIVTPTFTTGKIKRTSREDDRLGVIDKVLASGSESDRHGIEAAVARITSGKLNKIWDELAYGLGVCRMGITLNICKLMMGIFKECAETLVENFKTATKDGSPVEAKGIYGGYSMDVIASSAFSTKIDSHRNPENLFALTARSVFRNNFSWRFIMLFLFPKLVQLLRISIFPPKAIHFFRDVTLQIIEERKRTGQTRNDFLQLLMDTAKEESDDPKSELSEKENDDITSVYGEMSTNHQVFRGVTKKNLSKDELVAQCVIFFLAGYDSTASTLAFATYMLALNQDIQEKVHEEVSMALKSTNGKLTYEALQNIKYLDNIISKLYDSSHQELERRALTDYKLGETGITIPKGMIVTVPAYAMHRDPELFPDSEKFDPDRFTPEERAKRDPYAYMPFGAGPRNCIGMRFALMEIKVCLIYVIATFKIKRSLKTKVPLEYMIATGFLQPKDITLALERRKENPLVNEKRRCDE
ncbi:cytochrome P450 3A24 [Trichonephila clavipes]|nr:cytochrome P450 3A24 [Trichonephila clavipes]